MAFQLPKIDFNDAKTRVLIIVGGIAAFVGAIYFLVHFISNKTTTAGTSKLANAPGGLQSVPGGQLTPEYYRALVQANTQAAKQAKITGGSAVPTLLAEPTAQPALPQTEAAPSCSVVCPNAENVNVENDIKELVKTGKLSAEDGKKLVELAKQNVAVSEYTAQLNEMVKQGKLTPEQARKLIDDYKKQHLNNLMQESGRTMDALIKSGQLPIEVANDLLEMQKKKVSPTEYAEKLSQLVQEGKISPATASQLLAQYTEQQARENAAENKGELRELASLGKISPTVAKELEDYQNRGVSQKEYEEELRHLVRQGRLTPEQAERLGASYRQQVSPEVAKDLAEAQKRNVPIVEYQAILQRLVTAGKISPEQAAQLLENYRQIKATGRQAGELNDIVRQAEKANEDAVKKLAATGRISQETAQKLLVMQKNHVPVAEYKKQLDELVRTGKITPEDAQKLLSEYQESKTGAVQALLATGKISPEKAQKLLDMQAANVSPQEYKQQLDQLVAAGKITPEDAEQLAQKYEKLHGIRETADNLNALRDKNASVAEYANALKQAVAAGNITPEQATRLLQEYKNSRAEAAPLATATPLPNVKGVEAFAEMQKKVQAAAIATPAQTVAPPEQFSFAAAKAKAQVEQQELQRLQSVMNGMSQQAGHLISAWQPPTMTGQIGAAEKEESKAKNTGKGSTGSASSGGPQGQPGGPPSGSPLIKGGTILYAVLDTAVDSDFLDSPVMATIVDGPFRGAKLLGKLAVVQGQDRVSLTFKLMNMEDWPTGKTINAFAIDPDTARTVLASKVNYHYFVRYGSLFAASFVQGYASAISNSGATTSSGIFGTTTTHPQLSPSNKLATGLGQAGQTLGTAISGYINTPPTVKIDPGVSLGILFMTDVAG